MSKISTKHKDKQCKSIGDHQKYLSRITKTLYYGRLPKTDCLSLPVTEFAAEIFSEAQKGRSLDRLHCNDAAKISRNACISPCSLVLAILYLERLKKYNPEYLDRVAPSDLFLVSLMVSSKFLFDDGESDEVFMDEWSVSGGVSIKDLIRLEKDFLNAIEWKVYVNELAFWKKLHELEISLAKKQSTSRGFFTYTELHTLSTTLDIQNFINCVVAVSMILAATYTVGLLTLVGSVFLASQIPGTCLQPKRLENNESTTVPIMYESQSKLDDNLDILRQITEIKTDFNSKTNQKNIDALNVLKTGIILASIKSANPYCNDTHNGTDYVHDYTKNDAQFISWDWWTVPVMNWLTKSSEIVDKLEVPVYEKYFINFLENSVTNSKYIELEDQIHKATKTRIQDQMETSWHMEWIDTIKRGILLTKFLPPYLYNLKV